MWPREPKFGSLNTRVFIIMGFVISGFLPIQITVILPCPKVYFIITGTSLYRGSTVTAFLSSYISEPEIFLRCTFAGQWFFAISLTKIDPRVTWDPWPYIRGPWYVTSARFVYWSFIHSRLNMKGWLRNFTDICTSSLERRTTVMEEFYQDQWLEPHSRQCPVFGAKVYWLNLAYFILYFNLFECVFILYSKYCLGCFTRICKN